MTDNSDICPAYLPLLNSAELARADSLSHPLMRQRHIEVRARLRLLLADYLQQAPADIRIVRTEQGKPYVPDHPHLVFNISHTARQLVIAIAHQSQLGVDIEHAKPRANLAALVAKCFADVEATYWHSLPDTQKTTAFYRFWTKKEAFVKATGRGIALGLKDCVINPLRPETFLSLPKAYHPDSWRIIELQLATPTTDDLLCGAVVMDSPADVCYFRMV